MNIQFFFKYLSINFHTNYPQNLKRHLETGTHNNGKRSDYKKTI